MAGKGLHKEVRRELYGFARRVARWVSANSRCGSVRQKCTNATVHPGGQFSTV
jgi:hypothetical protein